MGAINTPPRPGPAFRGLRRGLDQGPRDAGSGRSARHQEARESAAVVALGVDDARPRAGSPARLLPLGRPAAPGKPDRRRATGTRYPRGRRRASVAGRSPARPPAGRPAAGAACCRRAAHPSRLAAQDRTRSRPVRGAAQLFAQTTLSLAEVNLQQAWLTPMRAPRAGDQPRAANATARQPEPHRPAIADRDGAQPGTGRVGGPRWCLVALSGGARAQGRLALAELGERWFNQCAGGGENFIQARHRLDVFLVEQQWWRSLAVVVAQVGHAWRQVPGGGDR